MRANKIFLTVILSVISTIILNAEVLTNQEIIAIVKDGNVLTVKNFLDKNQNFNIDTALDKWRYTMLMHAICDVHPDIVELLLKHGADPTIRAKDGFNSLDIVSSGNYLMSAEDKEKQIEFMRFQNKSGEDIAKWIENYDKQFSSEMHEERLKIKLLIEEAYTKAQNQNIDSSVWKFIKSGNLAALESLFMNGDITNVNMQNSNGETLLIVAVKNGQYDIVKALLAKGAEIGIMDKQKETAYSYSKKMFELIVKERQSRDIQGCKKIISEKKIDLEKKDKNGETLLMIAVAEGNLDTVKILLEAGASPNVKNIRGNSLEDVICTRGRYLKHKNQIMELINNYKLQNSK